MIGRFLATLATIALVLIAPGAPPAFGQTQAPLIVWLRSNAPEQPPGGVMREALARHGLVEDRDYRLVLKHSGGDNARFPALAAESVAEGAALLIAFGSAAVRAAVGQTQTIPIVGTGALVELGFAQSRNRPGGNVTGVDIAAPELDVKKFEVLKELLPEAQHITFIYDPTTSPTGRDRPDRMAASLGLSIRALPVTNLAELAAALAQAGEWGHPVNVGNSPLIAQNRPLVTDLVRRHRLAAICEWPVMAAMGCLASYGFTLEALNGHAADYAQRILRGAKPADLPIVSPTQFRFVINQRTAREIGLYIPLSVLARADEVIE